MEISASTLFNAIKEDPKQAKEMLKSALQKDISTSSTLENSTKMTNETVLKNANKLLDTLFSKVIDGSTSKSEAVKTIQNSIVFKQDQASTNELKNLLQLVRKEPKLSKFVAPLKDFLKHVSNMDGKNLSSQIQNSGVGFEAKLKKDSTTFQRTIKQTIKELIQELKSSQGQALKETPKLLDIANNILNKKNINLKNVQDFIKTLKDASLHVDKSISSLPQSSSFVSKKTIQQLIHNINKLDTLMQNSSKIASSSLKNEITSVIKSTIKEIAFILQKQDIPTNKIMQLQDTMKSIELLAKTVQEKLLSSGEKEALTLLITNQTSTTNISTSQPSFSLNIQEKIKLLSVKMKQALEIADKQSFHTNNGNNSIKKALTTLNKETTQFINKQNNSETNLSKALEKDIKNTLLKLSDATSSQNTPAQKEIHTLANKNLTNIQMHQLISYANSSIDTYIPYTWDGLSDGNISFKKGKEDSFYCQINLELQMYGKINMMLMLQEDRFLNISISTQKDILKDKIQDNLQELKSALIKVGLTPLHVKMKPMDTQGYAKEGWSDFSVSLRV